MGDELDGCECVWMHEIAMRRLLSMVHCCFIFFNNFKTNMNYRCVKAKITVLTPNVLIVSVAVQCDICLVNSFTNIAPGRLPNAVLPSGNEDNHFTIMTMLMMLVVFLYIIRPDVFMKFTNTKKITDQRPSQGQVYLFY